LDLEKDTRIPFSKKGVILRKRLEDTFGGIFREHARGKTNGDTALEVHDNRQGIEEVIIQTLVQRLGIPRSALLDNNDSTFAEVLFFQFME
jgi:hypothetical protein